MSLRWAPVLLCALFVSGCDDGRIYPPEPEATESASVTVSVRFQNTDIWPEAYSLVLGAFEEGASSPYLSKKISMPSSDEEILSLSLTGLSEQTHSVSIALLNRGREVQFNYWSHVYETPPQDLTLPLTEIDLVSYARIQSQIFSAYCSRCHGAGNMAAADLHLVEGASHDSLTEHPATFSEKFRVAPFEPEESFILEVLQNDVLKYNHTDVLPEAELIQLLRAWIEEGAPPAD